MSCYIVGQGAYCENVGAQLLPLKPLLKETLGRSVQRIGRFTQLALIGAARAADELPAASALYLSSGVGDMGAMVEVLDAIYRDKQVPRPLSFVNTVSNAACFHVVKTLGLVGPSVFLGSRYFSLEVALQTAALDLQSERIESALVGVVDPVVAPVADHARRLGVETTVVLAEGSHWLQLVRSPGARPVLGRLEPVRQFADREAVLRWLSQASLPSETGLALGQYVGSEEAQEWRARLRLSAFDYGEGLGHFDSRAGLVVTAFVERKVPSLLYLNRDPHGRYVTMVMHKQ